MNKMTAANLAVVFGPNLAWSNDKTMVGPTFLLLSDVNVIVWFLYLISELANVLLIMSIGSIPDD